MTSPTWTLVRSSLEPSRLPQLLPRSAVRDGRLLETVRGLLCYPGWQQSGQTSDVVVPAVLESWLCDSKFSRVSVVCLSVLFGSLPVSTEVRNKPGSVTNKPGPISSVLASKSLPVRIVAFTRAQVAPSPSRRVAPTSVGRFAMHEVFCPRPVTPQQIWRDARWSGTAQENSCVVSCQFGSEFSKTLATPRRPSWPGNFQGSEAGLCMVSLVPCGRTEAET